MRLFGLARKILLPVVAIVALVNVASVQAEFKDLPHPFMLWTKAEATAIKQRIDTDPQAQAQYEIMPVREGKAGGVTYPSLTSSSTP